MDIIMQTLAEVITILVGTALIYLLQKVAVAYDRAKKKDELGILDVVSDGVVELVERELGGQAGKQKLERAVALVTEIMNSKGIKVTSTEITAGIENGVNKLKLKQGQIGMNNILEESMDFIRPEVTG